MFYPKPENVRVVESRPGILATYQFASKRVEHKFCSICGVTTHIVPVRPPKDVLDDMSDIEREITSKLLQVMPINIRVLNNVNWQDVKTNNSNDLPVAA
jgi:hypothetical protein